MMGRLKLEMHKEVCMNKFHFSTVCIVLGTNCNFNCRYCMQHTGIKQPIENANNFEKIKPFIKEVKPKKILLWGGEPLLYWDKFKEVVLFVRSIDRDINIVTITNGSLLTQEKVDFFNKYNVGIGLSNDAFATQDTRFNDVLSSKKIFNLFKQIHSKGINTVISARTQDIYKVWQYYDEKFPNEHINVNFDMLKNFTMDKFLGDFDLNKFQITLNKLKQGFVKSVLSNDFNSREFSFFLPLISLTNKQVQLPQYKTLHHLKCGTMDSVIIVDFKGNIYKCKNSNEIIGNIGNLEQAKECLESKINIPSWCLGCPYEFICDTTGCVVETDEIKRNSCVINKMVYKTFFESLDCISNILNKSS